MSLENNVGTAPVVLTRDLNTEDCGRLRLIAEDCACTVSLLYNGRAAGTDRLRGLMNLGAVAGSTVFLKVHGSPAVAEALSRAVAALR